jgi:imidazoleglycerol-phosphate dehydratase
MTVGRRARVERTTKESEIVVELDLDGTGVVHVDTGVPFYDHMLTALGTHASFDLTVHAKGDVEIEGHHTIEDTAIVLGQALGQALGDKKGIRRFGDAFIPMDETLAHAIVDVSGRPYCVHTGEPDHLRHTTIAGSSVPYHTVINRHVFETLANNARIALQCTFSTVATHTTSPRPSTRPWPGHCGKRSRPIRGCPVCRPPKALCEK